MFLVEREAVQADIKKETRKRKRVMELAASLSDADLVSVIIDPAKDPAQLGV